MAMREYRYKTLAELKSAYDSGELEPSDFLMIDNDSTTVYQRGTDEYPKVFEGGCPGDLLEEALTLLGIPWKAMHDV